MSFTLGQQFIIRDDIYDSLETSLDNTVVAVLASGSLSSTGAPALNVINDGFLLRNLGDISSTASPAAINIAAEGALIINTVGGTITAENGEGVNASAITVTGSAAIVNRGTIDGDFNGVNFSGPDAGGSFINTNGATVLSDSRGVNIDGDGVTVVNSGNIIGTGDQRNGTVYSNETASNYTLVNTATGLIDAGEGNNGAGFSLSLTQDSGVNTVLNTGEIIGRQGVLPDGFTPASGIAGDGIRLEADAPDGTGLFEGLIVNGGLISSEGTVGPIAGFRAVNGVDFAGTLINSASGVIEGVNNGVYFGTGDHNEGLFINRGLVQSDSRALNIDGDGLTVVNAGVIIGTGDQRNGTIYSDDTASNFTFVNTAGALVDAGVGNQGAAFSLSQGFDNGVILIRNFGDIIGRGQAEASSPLAGDGIRLEADGPDATGLFEGIIDNRGFLGSESEVGATAGFRAVNGLDFAGTLFNSGTISGVQNGVYFGTGDHTEGQFINRGLVQSDSRALNIDGDGLRVVNAGAIIGTGDQRNGTVYSDDTASNFSLANFGLIDGGEGNNAAGFSLSQGFDNGFISIRNDGSIIGREGVLPDGFTPASGIAGDGIRLEADGPDGTGSFEGIISNTGLITSEGSVGPIAGFRAVNGLNFEGTLINDATISGVQNAVYFGTGDHSDGLVVNRGTFSSDSRAFNLDGDGLTVVNSGHIIGTGDQRNGTFYGDGTAEDYTIINTLTGAIDAGVGNVGSGLALETGDTVGDIVSGLIVNDGLIQGQGDGTTATLIGHGLRLNAGVGTDGDASFDGVIFNSGTINGADGNALAAGVSLEGISLTGVLVNTGTISGFANAIDASTANGVNIINAGTLNGNVLLSAGDDVFVVEAGSTIYGTVYAGDGVDTLILSDGTAVEDVDTDAFVGFEFVQVGEDVFSFSDLVDDATDLLDGVDDSLEGPFGSFSNGAVETSIDALAGDVLDNLLPLLSTTADAAEAPNVDDALLFA